MPVAVSTVPYLSCNSEAKCQCPLLSVICTYSKAYNALNCLTKCIPQLFSNLGWNKIANTMIVTVCMASLYPYLPNRHRKLTFYNLYHKSVIDFVSVVCFPQWNYLCVYMPISHGIERSVFEVPMKHIIYFIST